MSDDTIDAPVRACRDCGEEYRPGILVCADCGGEVVERRAAVEASAPQTATAATVPEHHGVIYSSSRMSDLLPLCDRLAEAGVEHDVHERAASSRSEPALYAILVHEADRLRALEVLADLIAPHETGGDVRAIEHAYDPEHGYLRCPSCGASTPRGARECPDCGLGLPGEEAAPEPPE